jgi:hypothetical protein
VVPAVAEQIARQFLPKKHSVVVQVDLRFLPSLPSIYSANGAKLVMQKQLRERIIQGLIDRLFSLIHGVGRTCGDPNPTPHRLFVLASKFLVFYASRRIGHKRVDRASA